MNAAVEAPAASPRFRLKLIPLLVTAALGYGTPVAGAYLAHGAIRLLHLSITPGFNVGWLYLQHSGQLLVALAAIAALKYTVVPADYGLHLPRGKPTSGRRSVGHLFRCADDGGGLHADIIAHIKPDPGFPLTSANIWGWLTFEGLYVGPTEEIPFRALLVTYLAATMPGKLRVGRFEMNWAGVLAAIIFALMHASSFDTRAWEQALGQQVYAFALGALCVSGSKIAKHRRADNRSQFQRRSGQLLVFLWIAA